MARSENEQDFVTFEVPPISVGAESEALSEIPLVGILEHFKAIRNGKKRFNTFKVWKFYRGVPLFIAEVAGELMVYAAEDLGGTPPACKISVLFAGTRKTGCVTNAGTWIGANDEVLWTAVVLPRCQQHFG